MQVREQQPRAAVGGASGLAGTGGGAHEGVFAGVAGGLDRTTSGTGASLVGAQGGGHDQASEGDGQVGRTKRGHQLGETCRRARAGARGSSLSEPKPRSTVDLPVGSPSFCGACSACSSSKASLVAAAMYGVPWSVRAWMPGQSCSTTRSASTTWSAHSRVSMTTESNSRRSRPPMSCTPTSLSGTPKTDRSVVSAPTWVPGRCTSKRKRGRRGGLRWRRRRRGWGGVVRATGGWASQWRRVRSGSDRALQNALLVSEGSSVDRRSQAPTSSAPTAGRRSGTRARAAVATASRARSVTSSARTGSSMRAGRIAG